MGLLQFRLFTVSIYVVDDIAYFGVSWILAERSQYGSKFFRRNVTIFVFVEVCKRLLQFCIEITTKISLNYRTLRLGYWSQITTVIQYNTIQYNEKFALKN